MDHSNHCLRFRFGLLNRTVATLNSEDEPNHGLVLGLAPTNSCATPTPTPTSPNFIFSCAVLSLVRVRGFLSKFDFYNCPIPGHSTSPRNQLARPGISLPLPCLALSLCQHLHLAVRTTDISTFKFAYQIQFSTIPAHECERLSHGAVRNLPSRLTTSGSLRPSVLGNYCMQTVYKRKVSQARTLPFAPTRYHYNRPLTLIPSQRTSSPCRYDSHISSLLAIWAVRRDPLIFGHFSSLRCKRTRRRQA
jgi:hypothetical protein